MRRRPQDEDHSNQIFEWCRTVLFHGFPVPQLDGVWNAVIAGDSRKVVRSPAVSGWFSLYWRLPLAFRFLDM